MTLCDAIFDHFPKLYVKSGHIELVCSSFTRQIQRNPLKILLTVHGCPDSAAPESGKSSKKTAILPLDADIPVIFIQL